MAGQRLTRQQIFASASSAGLLTLSYLLDPWQELERYSSGDGESVNAWTSLITNVDPQVNSK